MAIGLRPINNIVDVTNYVLHELGTPLHAFDAAKVQGGIVTRTAYEGETFKALDGQEYTLNCTDLVVADQSGKALAIGGGRRWAAIRDDWPAVWQSVPVRVTVSADVGRTFDLRDGIDTSGGGT